MKNFRILLSGAAVLALAAGCTGPGGATPKGGAAKSGKSAQDEEHAHGPGPHGGTVADWGGGKYHVEFTVSHPDQQATVYLLGSDEKTPAPIKAKDDQLLLTIKEPPLQVTLKASPQPGDPEGKSSRFVGKHEKLGKEQEFAGTITGEADGTPYAGEFKEEPGSPKK
jgi:hypothetical protein